MTNLPHISTLSVIESHIRTLEFAWATIKPNVDLNFRKQLESELGIAYKVKMQILKMSNHGSNYSTSEKAMHSRSKKYYPSKLDSEADTLAVYRTIESVEKYREVS